MLRRLINLPYRLLWKLRFPNITIGARTWVDARRVRGLGRTSTLNLGDQSICHADISFDRPTAKVIIGNRSYIGRSTLVSAEHIEIGDDVLISWGVTIVDHDSHHIDFSLRKNDVIDWGHGQKDWTHVNRAPVTVMSKVWIGFNVIVLKGVTIGTGSVVAAGAIVTKDVPAWTVVAGCPAKVVKELSPSGK